MVAGIGSTNARIEAFLKFGDELQRANLVLS